MEQLRWGKYSYKFAKGHLTWIARVVFDWASGQFWSVQMSLYVMEIGLRGVQSRE